MNYRLRFFALLGVGLLTPACQQEMARQPAYRPLERTTFFADGRASRSLVEGTIPWRRDGDDDSIVSMYRHGPEYADVGRAVALIGNPTMNQFAALIPFTRGGAVSDYVDVCPIPIDKKALERGRERYNIYCAVCHDELGTGNGKIVERGYLKPPNYHTDDSRGLERRGYKIPLRSVPIGYFFEVITRGYGGMPDYASQITPEDRWKIIAYIRVLQRSQWVPLADLPEKRRESIQAKLKAVEEQK
jgi:mono/diheme cytochrome c family protein